MYQGTLQAIFVADESAGPMCSVESAQALAGRGLVGDRYGQGSGTFAKASSPDREVTLIEAEAIAAASREYELVMTPSETRRNLVTQGVPLNHLVGVEFMVGAVRLRGIRLCEPCKHLEQLTRDGVLKALIHRGGLRAQVIQGGTISRGDTIQNAAT